MKRKDRKVVILKGAGLTFCAGHDLEKVFKVYEEWDEEPGKKHPSQRSRLHVDRTWMRDLYQAILLHPRVTIAQIHGYCIGKGI